MADEREDMSIKAKLSKLQCPFTWEILDSMVKHFTINIRNDEDDRMMDDETFYPVERLLISLFKCYKAVLSADKDEAMKRMEKAEEILMEIQQEYTIYNIYLFMVCF